MNKSSLLVKITYILVSTHMLSVDHSNIDGPPLGVKCVRKLGSALGGEVTSLCVCVCVCFCFYCLEFNFLQKLSGRIRLCISGVEVGAPYI